MTGLGSEFDRALDYALDAHRTQVRKTSEDGEIKIPYAAHLLAVASLILEAGGDEKTAIAGLLHDVIEDQGAHHLEAVRSFGDDVAQAVLECSAEAKSDDAGWRERKERYIQQMRVASPMALRVSLADKVHNLRSIVADYRVLGDRLLARFNAPDMESVLWYYDELASVYRGRAAELHAPHLDELSRTIGRLRLLLSRPDCPACGAADVLPMLIGLPTHEDMMWAAAGEAVISGCIVGPENPDWACRQCGHSWPDADRTQP